MNHKNETLHEPHTEANNLMSKSDGKESEKIKVVEIPLKGWFFIQKLNEDQLEDISVPQKGQIDSFMNIANKAKSQAQWNIVIYVIDVFFYCGFFCFHWISVFVLGQMPLTYVKIVWINHVLVVFYWAGFILTFMKVPLYSNSIRKAMNEFYEKEGVDVNFHGEKNALVFRFNEDLQFQLNDDKDID